MKVAQSEWPIKPSATTPELTEELIELSHETVAAILPLYVAGEIQPADQLSVTMAPAKQPTYSRKLTRGDGVLDFTKPAEQLEREVRAYAGWPRSRTKLKTTEVVVTAAHVTDGSGQPGSLFIQNKELGVYTPKGVLMIDRLIPAGKKQMTAKAFLAGYHLN